MRSASARLAQPSGGLPDAYFALNESKRSQQIRFCRSPDGVQIAYAISGKGPPILRAAHWMSHLQYEWESPVWRHWIDALSKGNTLIRYDERGNGLSDWNASDLSFAAMVCDLESVADANILNGSRCWVSRKAVRYRSPTPSDTPSAYLTWSSMADTQRVGESGMTATKLIPMKP
jgi:hypothetical protein